MFRGGFVMSKLMAVLLQLLLKLELAESEDSIERSKEEAGCSPVNHSVLP
jgi:hypothetical protein